MSTMTRKEQQANSSLLVSMARRLSPAGMIGMPGVGNQAGHGGGNVNVGHVVKGGDNVAKNVDNGKFDNFGNVGKSQNFGGGFGNVGNATSAGNAKGINNNTGILATKFAPALPTRKSSKNGSQFTVGGGDIALKTTVPVSKTSKNVDPQSLVTSNAKTSTSMTNATKPTLPKRKTSKNVPSSQSSSTVQMADITSPISHHVAYPPPPPIPSISSMSTTNTTTTKQPLSPSRTSQKPPPSPRRGSSAPAMDVTPPTSNNRLSTHNSFPVALPSPVASERRVSRADFHDVFTRSAHEDEAFEVGNPMLAAPAQLVLMEIPKKYSSQGLLDEVSLRDSARVRAMAAFDGSITKDEFLAKRPSLRLHNRTSLVAQSDASSASTSMDSPPTNPSSGSSPQRNTLVVGAPPLPSRPRQSRQPQNDSSNSPSNSAPSSLGPSPVQTSRRRVSLFEVVEEAQADRKREVEETLAMMAAAAPSSPPQTGQTGMDPKSMTPLTSRRITAGRMLPLTLSPLIRSTTTKTPSTAAKEPEPPSPLTPLNANALTPPGTTSAPRVGVSHSSTDTSPSHVHQRKGLTVPDSAQHNQHQRGSASFELWNHRGSKTGLDSPPTKHRGSVTETSPSLGLNRQHRGSAVAFDEPHDSTQQHQQSHSRRTSEVSLIDPNDTFMKANSSSLRDRRVSQRTRMQRALETEASRNSANLGNGNEGSSLSTLLTESHKRDISDKIKELTDFFVELASRRPPEQTLFLLQPPRDANLLYSQQRAEYLIRRYDASTLAYPLRRLYGTAPSGWIPPDAPPIKKGEALVANLAFIGQGESASTRQMMDAITRVAQANERFAAVEPVL